MEVFSHIIFDLETEEGRDVLFSVKAFRCSRGSSVGFLKFASRGRGKPERPGQTAKNARPERITCNRRASSGIEHGIRSSPQLRLNAGVHDATPTTSPSADTPCPHADPSWCASTEPRNGVCLFFGIARNARPPPWGLREKLPMPYPLTFT
jgi:hypothetical protein